MLNLFLFLCKSTFKTIKSSGGGPTTWWWDVVKFIFRRIEITLTKSISFSPLVLSLIIGGRDGQTGEMGSKRNKVWAPKFGHCFTLDSHHYRYQYYHENRWELFELSDGRTSRVKWTYFCPAKIVVFYHILTSEMQIKGCAKHVSPFNTFDDRLFQYGSGVLKMEFGPNSGLLKNLGKCLTNLLNICE